MNIETFADRDAAANGAADLLAAALERRLDAQKRASMIVTGGSSPGACYRALAQKPLAWDRTDIVLSDERWVEPQHEDSNERLVRQSLLVDAAAGANLVGVYRDDETLEGRVRSLDGEIRMLGVPFAATLLGMGTDGHIASLFPDAEHLEAGLDADNPDLCLAVDTAASPYRRLSLTMSAIARSDVVALLIFGDEKKAVVEAALGGDTEYPVAALLRQKKAPVTVFWAA